MIFVIATLDIADGRRDDFFALFHKLVPQVLEESGCIEYGPAVDSDTDIQAQKRVGDNAVVVMEKWESIDALKAHLVAPHMLEYRGQVKGILSGMTLQILQPA